MRSTMHRRNLLSHAGAVAASITLGPVALVGAQAQTPAPVAAYPTKPIRFIVPFAAGGPIDVTTRLLAEQVRESIGPIVVENRPGAGGNIGVDLVAKAPADGYTLGIAAVAMHAINPWLFSRMPFDATVSYTHLTLPTNREV